MARVLPLNKLHLVICQAKCDKQVPRVAVPVQSPLRLKSAGIAMLASAALVFAPMAEAAPTLSFASPEVKAKLEERDAAMDYKCKGGMFDCDGDRREFAKKQYENFVSRMEGPDSTPSDQTDQSTSSQQQNTATDQK